MNQETSRAQAGSNIIVRRIIRTVNRVRTLLGDATADSSPPAPAGETALIHLPHSGDLPAPLVPESPSTPERSLVQECSDIGVATAQSSAGVRRDAVIQAFNGMVPGLVHKYQRKEASEEERRRKAGRVARLDGDIEEAESDVPVANSEARKRRAWLESNKPVPRPGFSAGFSGSVVALITLSVAPALHDMFKNLDDPLLQWALAFLIGLAVGVFVIAALTPEGGPPPKVQNAAAVVPANRFDLANGLAVSFFVIRLAFVRNLAGFLLTVGGLVLEIVVIRVVRAKAAELAESRLAWLADEKRRQEIESQAMDAESAAFGLSQHIVDLKREREGLLAWIENERRLSDPKEMEALAMKTLVGAYSHELLKMEGRQRRSFKEVA